MTVWFSVIGFFCQAQLFTIGLGRGLSNSSVKCIVQDSKGFMWFGTFDGLNRYDGYEIKTYRNKINDIHSLPHNYIYCVEEDKLHNLYIGTGQGVGIYNHNFDSFTRLQFHPHWDKNDVQYLNADSKTIQVNNNNDIFIGTNGWGMFVKKSNNKIADWIPISKKNGEYTYYYHASSIHITSDQRVWVFINERGLYEYIPLSNKLVQISTEISSATSIKHDPSGNLYIGNESGLHILNPKTRKYIEHFDQAFNLSNINQMAFEGDTLLWIAMQSGVSIWNTRKKIVERKYSKLDKTMPLSGNSVFSICIDQDNRKWLGTTKGGVNIIDPSKYSFGTEGNIFYRSSNISPLFVRSFLEVSNSKVYVGTEGNGLQQWNRETSTLDQINLPIETMNGASINYLLKDYTGSLWLSSNHGIYIYKSGNLRKYRCISEKGIENKDIEVLYEGPSKTLWAASFGNGKLYRYNRSMDKFEVFCPSIIDLSSLREDNQGNLWAGNHNQLIKINIHNGSFKTFDIGKPVRDIFFDAKNRLWLGTEGKGLILFDQNAGKIVKTYADADGLANNSVLRIEEDKSGNLWLSTFEGLSKFDSNRKEFMNFDQSDGLQSNEFSYGASIKLSDGSLAFGGINGFNIFHPDKIKPLIHKPKIAITSIRINNSLLNDTIHKAKMDDYGNIQKLILPYNQAILSLGFAALEFSSPQRIKYRYMLEGLDKEWNIAGSVRSINYNNLAEGNYILRIQASDSEGKWKGNEALLEIQVLPPWYRSWWAYIVYLIILFWAVKSYSAYRQKQMNLKYEFKVAKLNMEKEKELNEKRQSFFTNISHEFRTPLTLIINPVKELLKSSRENEETKQLNTIQRNAKRLLSLVDQLLLFQKSEQDGSSFKPSQFDFITFVKEIYLCFAYQAKIQNIDYNLETPQNQIFVEADREKLEIILFNLISNAFKFTPEGGNINIKVKNELEELYLSISDSGVGIKPEVGDQIFQKFYSDNTKGIKQKPGFGIGMFLTRQFVEMHEGCVNYSSELKKGTTFKVTLPIVLTDYIPDEQIVTIDTESAPIVVPELLGNTFEEDDNNNFTPAIEAPKKDQEITEKATLLVVDDDQQIREYLIQLFDKDYIVYAAANGESAWDIVQSIQPEIVISDVVMGEINGIELCAKIKSNPKFGHIQVVLLTNSSSDAFKLEGIEEGADDYINKPFDSDLLKARVNTLVKNRKNLQQFFYNAVTLKSNDLKISKRDKEFIEQCIKVVEDHIKEEDFNVKKMAYEIGVSHSSLYKRVKAISGKSVNEFVRDIRLRKAAQLFIDTDLKVNEAANKTGFYDIKYFRVQFSKLFGMNPSDYIKHYRKAFQNGYRVKDE